MTNHFHAIMQARNGYELSAIVRDYKKHVSKLLVKSIQSEPESRREWMLHRFEWAAKHDKRITNYQFWQESNHAIHLDPLFPEKFEQRVNYIHENPVRAGIVNEAKDYLYSSAIDYAGGKGLIDIMPIQ